MSGLFERDYTVVYESEIKEKEELDAKYNPNPNKIGKICIFRKYPKAIRHNMSLFPNNYMDINILKDEDELIKECDGFENLLSNKNITELDIKRYIQDNKYYQIPASIFSRYQFGHHQAVLFKEFQLGTSYKADYVLAGLASGGWQFVFIEFENPYGSVTINDGNFGIAIRKGINQINDWKAFLESNYSSVHSEFLKHTTKPLPKEFVQYDSSRIHYVVVVGRREDFENDRSRREQRKYEQDQDIKIIHYDNLLDDARRLINANTY